MAPVYIKKSDPKDRTTWIDKFIASDPKGGAVDAVEMARNGRAKAVFAAILAVGRERRQVAA